MTAQSNWDGKQWDPAGRLLHFAREAWTRIVRPPHTQHDINWGPEQAVTDHEEWEQRVEAVKYRASKVGGPLGVFMQELSSQYEEFQRDDVNGCTTVRESERWVALFEAAESAVDYLDGMDLR